MSTCRFGSSVAISGDTIVVGSGGAVTYVFVRAGSNWAQQAYLEASNIEGDDYFGAYTLAISGDTIVVGAPGEASNATGVNGDQSNNSAQFAGAAYVFVREGTNWTQQLPAASPSPRAYHTMTYDSARGRVVLLGGYASGGHLGDTWEWDGTNWTQQSSVPGPSPRVSGMAHDSGRGLVVLFGGSTCSI